METRKASDTHSHFKLHSSTDTSLINASVCMHDTDTTWRRAETTRMYVAVELTTDRSFVSIHELWRKFFNKNRRQSRTASCMHRVWCLTWSGQCSSVDWWIEQRSGWWKRRKGVKKRKKKKKKKTRQHHTPHSTLSYAHSGAYFAKNQYTKSKLERHANQCIAARFVPLYIFWLNSLHVQSFCSHFVLVSPFQVVS